MAFTDTNGGQARDGRDLVTTTLLLECLEQANYIALRACYAPPIESIQLNLPIKANMPNPCNGGRRRVIGTYQHP